MRWLHTNPNWVLPIVAIGAAVLFGLISYWILN